MIKLDSKLFDINNIPQFRQEFDKFHELELKTKNFNVYNNSIFNDEQTAILLEHNEERDLIFLLNLAKSAYLTPNDHNKNPIINPVAKLASVLMAR